tara:strand:+ start:1659 stop:1934 length:276 start_codon:yes stop_codon:yes gene_type:complete
MSKYYTDQKVRRKIDALLEINACIQANMGTKSMYDMENPRAAEQIWFQFLVEIRKMDEDFYNVISTIEEKEMVTKKIYNKRRFRETAKADV